MGHIPLIGGIKPYSLRGNGSQVRLLAGWVPNNWRGLRFHTASIGVTVSLENKLERQYPATMPYFVLVRHGKSEFNRDTNCEPYAYEVDTQGRRRLVDVRSIHGESA